VTDPVAGLTVAIVVLLLVQMPPAAALLSESVPPTHVVVGPEMADMETTDMVLVATQPLLGVNVTMALPGASPTIWSVGTGQTIEVLLDDHVPGAAACDNVANVPKHIVD